MIECDSCGKSYLECQCQWKCDQCGSTNIQWYDDGDGYVDRKCNNCGNWL